MRKRALLLFLCAAVVFAQDSAEIQIQLERMNVLGSVLLIAAHPDDENSSLLPYLAKGRKLRTAYLSLTRGEGGQNLIGSEQGDLLGVIRTQELLAARRIDGAQQYFTRAIDFGFTKTPEETLAKWGREPVLSDVVRVIRGFQPDVVILRFSGTPRDGHGQHQVSAILAKEAFGAAADPGRFPEQGLKPWKATRLLHNLPNFTRDFERRSAETPGKIELDAGEFSPLLGRSYAEIGGLARSRHRSQGMGASERKGSLKEYFLVTEGRPAQGDIFDGIDMTWSRVPGGSEAGRILAEAAAKFSPGDPAVTIPLLLRARAIVRAIDDPWARRKLAELDEAIVACGGLWLDAAAEQPAAVPGSMVRVILTALNRSRFPFEWKVTGPRVYNVPARRPQEIRLAADEPPTQSFWLAHPKQGLTYHVEPEEQVIQPENTPRSVSFEIQAGVETLVVRRPVLYRYVDPAEGELTRPFVVTPPVSVSLPETVFLFRNDQPQTIPVRVRATTGPASGEVRLGAEAGWRIETQQGRYELTAAGQEQEIAFVVAPPPGRSQTTLRASAFMEGRQNGQEVRTITYPHFPPQQVLLPAEARLERFDVTTLARKVGYIMGAGDEVPHALHQLGCEVTLLSAEDLVRRDLSGFDAIVAGVRAYNVRSDLRANHPRLIQYVAEGGTYIVQYNVARARALGEVGPFPLTLGTERVTVEESPVVFPNPRHPLLQKPNVITSADFEGWVQERGLYFASQWDPRYESVFSSNDPGQAPQAGGILYARHDKGVYIFTGYSWFRQLPAGVPGAYRLFANFLSAGKTLAH